MTEEKKKKEIEKMAKVIFDNDRDLICSGCGNFESCREAGTDECASFKFMAEHLVDADYGNIKQAQIEILEKLKDTLTNFAGGDNEEEVLSKIEVCMEVENYIDELIKEINKE